VTVDEARCLVVAKAPTPGLCKTRLGRVIGMNAAAEVAAAALADTLDVCAETFGRPRCRLALVGDLAEVARQQELAALLDGWQIFSQRGEEFADRLVNAHHDCGSGPIVQIGMDTPQLTPELLTDVERSLHSADAVLGPALDGGWWVLGLRDPAQADVLRGLPMSTPTTYLDTRAALEAAGLAVATASMLRDVDTVDDAAEVARSAPASRLASAWAEVAR
jgi:uncharacterized protein